MLPLVDRLACTLIGSGVAVVRNRQCSNRNDADYSLRAWSAFLSLVLFAWCRSLLRFRRSWRKRWGPQCARRDHRGLKVASTAFGPRHLLSNAQNGSAELPRLPFV